MNDKTIRGLYLGKIRPADPRGSKTEQYTAHYKEFVGLYEQLEALLPNESRQTLETMIEENNAAQSEEIADAFVKGFRLGMRLAAEGLRFEAEAE